MELLLLLFSFEIEDTCGYKNKIVVGESAKTGLLKNNARKASVDFFNTGTKSPMGKYVL